MSAFASPALRPIGESSSSSPFRLPRRVFVGQIVTPVSLLKVKFIKRGILGVGSTGLIRFIEDLDLLENGNEDDGRTATPVSIPGKASSSDHLANSTDQFDLRLPPSVMEDTDLAENDKGGTNDGNEQALIEHVVQKHGWRLRDCETVMLSKHSFLSPGFVDTHVHAPQVPNLGRGQQYQLQDWLENITFPLEKKFEDPIYARKTYEQVIQRMLNSGTTCAAIYATLHEEASMILANICNEKGMRAFVGKCQMDRNAPVEYKEKNSSASMESTKRFVNYCRNMAPYGTPKSSDHDPTNSSGSPEMDESIARLSATMNGIMNGHEGAQGGKQSRRVSNASASTDPQSSSLGASSESSEVSTAPTSLSMSSHNSHSSASNNMHRKASMNAGRKSVGGMNSSVSGATSQGRQSVSSSQSGIHGSNGSGTATPRRQKEFENANALVQPILTPRFAIACSDALLASISAMLSRDGSLRIQTHLAENEGEIEFTKKLFPFCETYTDVYEHFSLLTQRTILAHAVHLDEKEMKLIAERKCGVSHCPTSNLNLRSGTSRLGELLNRGVKVGLGTDMSGGYGMSVLHAVRDASVVAKVLQLQSNSFNESQRNRAHHEPSSRTNGNAAHDFLQGPLPIATLFYLATLGGAEVCNVGHRCGSFDTGKEFDAILFACDNSNPNLYIEEDDDLTCMLEKTLFCGDDRNIASVFVRGRVVGGSAPIADVIG